MTDKVWDRYDILAEIKRRGSSLRQISLEAGEHPDTCGQALCKSFPKGERLIAEFLGIPPSTLWPGRYQTKSKKVPSHNSNATNGARQSVKPTDSAAKRSAA